MAANSGVSVIDVDSHVYEPTAIWDEYVEPAYRPLARAGFWHDVDGDGNAVTIVNGALAPELNRSRIVRQAIWRPGSRAADIGALDPTVFHELNPGAWDPLVRLPTWTRWGSSSRSCSPRCSTSTCRWWRTRTSPRCSPCLQRLGLRLRRRRA